MKSDNSAAEKFEAPSSSELSAAEVASYRESQSGRISSLSKKICLQIFLCRTKVVRRSLY